MPSVFVSDVPRSPPVRPPSSGGSGGKRRRCLPMLESLLSPPDPAAVVMVKPELGGLQLPDLTSLASLAPPNLSSLASLAPPSPHQLASLLSAAAKLQQVAETAMSKWRNQVVCRIRHEEESVDKSLKIMLCCRNREE